MYGITILGSPNCQGNNAQLLYQATDTLEELQPALEFEHLVSNTLTITPCQDCGQCQLRQGCCIEDDMIDLYHKFDRAAIILIASPLYFNTVSAQLKILIDRCQALWANKLVLEGDLIATEQDRLGAFISTAGQPLTDSRFDHAIATMELFFKAVSARYYDNFLVGNVDQQPISKRPQVLAQAQDWGAKLAQEL